MSKKVKKLTRLKNPESFIQANTIKGFKYIDNAGEIVNSYHNKNVVPLFQMTPTALVIEKPKDKIDALKISSQVVWAKFSEIDSLDQIANLFSKEAENIFQILEVTRIRRLGWRNYFVYELDKSEPPDKYFKKFSVIPSTKTSIVRMEAITSKDFGGNLMLQPVIKNDPDKTLGILFDIDLFREVEIDAKDVSATLTAFRKYLTDENGFLKIVNDTLT